MYDYFQITFQAVHGPYDPAVFYGKRDIPLSQVRIAYKRHATYVLLRLGFESCPWIYLVDRKILEVGAFVKGQ